MTSLESRLVEFALADLAVPTELVSFEAGIGIEGGAGSGPIMFGATDLGAVRADTPPKAPAMLAESLARKLTMRVPIAGGEDYPIELWIPTVSCFIALSGAEHTRPAALVGLESSVRLLKAMERSISGDGWDFAGIAGAIGASLAAVRLMDLTPPQASVALALSVVQAPLCSVAADSALKGLLIGQTAANTIEASQVARFGLTAPESAITGERGLFRVLDAEPADWDEVFDGIGSVWTSMPMIEHLFPPGPARPSTQETQ